MKFFVVFCLLTASAFGQVFPDKYHTYAEAYSELQALASSHPSICRIDSIGFSNRDSIKIFAIKISDNVSVDEDEPAVFFCGGVHADEILGPEVAIGFAKNIVQKYDSGDTAAVNYVNNIEIFVVPFSNPEGHIWVEQGHLVWRKNKSDNDHNGIFDFHDGVDGNRNFDFGWSIDTGLAATTPESLMYRGPTPFSESENRSLADLGWKYRPLVALDYHSPTYGLTEKAYYPWYWYANVGGHGMAPDEALMADICRQYCSRIINDAGDSCYEARRGLVNKGDFKTYYYGNFGSVAFSVEISDTTIQDTSLVDGIVARHLPGEYYLLQRTLGPGITGVIRDSLTLAPLEAEVQVLERINADINPRLSRPDFGRYRRVLSTGTYTLRFIKSGYQIKNIGNVVVTNGPPTVTNVKLMPLWTPPPAPILVSPTNNQTLDTTYASFIWRSAPTATRYIIEIAGDSLFASYFAIDSTLGDTTYHNISPFTIGNYFWRVTAANASGYSPRSQANKFEVILPPPAPILISPGNDTTLNTSFVTFKWHKQSTATNYIIEIDNDSLFGSLDMVDSTLMDTTYQNMSAFADGRYFWRITAHNTAGYSPRSQVSKFDIALPPLAPILISPQSDTTFDTTLVTFKWHKSSTAFGYVIEVDNDSLFGSPNIVDSALADTIYHNLSALANGRYFWRITAHNTAGYSPRSQRASFVINVVSVIFIPGDVNNNQEVRGSDVTYLVRYLKGIGAPPPVVVNGFYPAADVNGDCLVRGGDVTYLVRYFKGGSPPVDGHCFQ
jgi:hypothetical protein